ncbi:glycosyltransferase family 4 protein [uncultured Aliivibrio sp.]|uniref:glycosyltransferase family 4 protein n=1 Tax=uncultured Aliivibrio sp. TaxID=873085 RepID=UPI0026223AB3|nr:glycosyltransferase family 4 protein [uncultured Aliivibrio sp.]
MGNINNYMINTTIIHINLASGFGGGEVQTLNLIKELSDYNQLIITKNRSPFSNRINELSQNQGNISQVSITKAIKFCWKNKKVIIHAHDGRGAHVARLIGTVTNKKYVISRRVDKLLKGKSSEKSYQKAAAIVAVSEKVAGNVRELNENTHVIYDSYSRLPYHPSILTKLNSLEGKFIVTQLGSLLDIKNIPFTIELAKRLETSHPFIHFLIVGEGKEEEKLKEMAEGLTNLTFFGFTPYVASILKLTNLLCMPSKSEGLGSAILEAYQHNIPVIASNVGGMPEIVIHNETGYLIELNDLDTAEKDVITLATDKDIYRKFVENISQNKMKYSPEHMAQSYIKCYRHIL